ncbi:MAG: hypothetical protein ACE5EF_09085, partial [Dehalococcoidia bacterium]
MSRSGMCTYMTTTARRASISYWARGTLPNPIVYLAIRSQHAALAKRVFAADPGWVAPPLWL